VYLDEVKEAVLDEKVTPLEEHMVRTWSTANLTPAMNGLGHWSLDEIAQYLEVGHNAHAGAFGPMIEVIANSTSHLTDSDRTAMAIYLKDLVADSSDAVKPPPPEKTSLGAAVYTARCGDCHQPTGLGMPPVNGATKTAPPLAGNAAVQAASPATLINVILFGAHGGTLAADPQAHWPWPKMSGFELSVGLDDDRIAALATYVRSAWGNRAAPVAASEVSMQH
jgi:mono/diheme cytochrome c family protein